MPIPVNVLHAMLLFHPLALPGLQVLGIWVKQGQVQDGRGGVISQSPGCVAPPPLA